MPWTLTNWYNFLTWHFDHIRCRSYVLISCLCSKFWADLQHVWQYLRPPLITKINPSHHKWSPAGNKYRQLNYILWKPFSKCSGPIVCHLWSWFEERMSQKYPKGNAQVARLRLARGYALRGSRPTWSSLLKPQLARRTASFLSIFSNHDSWVTVDFAISPCWRWLTRWFQIPLFFITVPDSYRNYELLRALSSWAAPLPSPGRPELIKDVVS